MFKKNTVCLVFILIFPRIKNSDHLTYLIDALKDIVKSYLIVPDDFALNVFQYLEKYGYDCEEHKVTTEDGYILALHRIPHGRDKIQNDHNPDKPAVLLISGLACSSIDWIYLGPGKSLGLMLADAGYDVWLGNNRGNRWSRQHETLDPDKDKEFWNFSFDEFGYYDVPAFIDYILNETGNEKIYYIGYSQGTTQFFVMSTERPEYSNKVAHMTALAPTAYLSKSTSVMPKFVANYLPTLEAIFDYFQIYEFLRWTDLQPNLGAIFCAEGTPTHYLCAHLIFYIFGEDNNLLNRTWLPVLISNSPSGTSIKAAIHLLQLFREDSFRKFDYGFQGNLDKYNTTTPPIYDLSTVMVPVAIYCTENDVFASIKDVNKLVKQLPNVVKYHIMTHENFSHLDFAMAKDADILIYNNFIQYLNQVSQNGAIDL